MMGAIFHNYKQLLQITKEEDITIDEESLGEDPVSLLEYISYTLDSYYMIIYKIICIINNCFVA